MRLEQVGNVPGGGARGGDGSLPTTPNGSAQSQPQHRRLTSAWYARGGVAALLLLSFLIQLPRLNDPLLEAHGFRQTQTAYQALEFHHTGVSLMHPKVPVFGSPYELPFEFPLFQAGAATLMSWGLSPDVAMRTTGLLCFLLTALLLFGLVRHVAGRVAGFSTLLFFLFSPMALLWSKTAMVDHLALAAAVGWTWSAILSRQRSRSIFVVIAVAAGSIAMLVKPTTAAFWVLPVIAAWVSGPRRDWRTTVRPMLDPALFAIVAIPFAMAILWTHHADAVKTAQPATVWLTSRNLNYWIYGPLDQRFVLSNWSSVFGRIQSYISGFPPLLLLGAAPLLGRRCGSTAFWSALALVPVLTVPTFWNLYVVHDYYLIAVTPVFAAVLGLGVASAWGSGWVTRGIVATAVATWILGMLLLSAPYWRVGYKWFAQGLLPVAQELDRLTTESDLVAFEGYDWSPEIPYYARRRGFMIRANPSVGERLTANRLAAGGYRTLLTQKLEGDLAMNFLTSRPWTGALGQWTYAVGDRWSDLRGALAGATAADVGRGAALIVDHPTTIRCGDGPQVVPRAAGTTLLRLGPGTSAAAKVSVSNSLGALPAREWIFLRQGLEEGPIHVSCRGASDITIDAVYSQQAGLD